ncbi:hypothetical protein ACFL27_28675, partial [candidate division CSSED10-310 bacterium]
CEEKNEIKVKGIAYPIQVFQVVDFYDHIPQGQNAVQKELDGFSLAIDFVKLAPDDKEKIIEIMRTTISRIEADLKAR